MAFIIVSAVIETNMYIIIHFSNSESFIVFNNDKLIK